MNEYNAYPKPPLGLRPRFVYEQQRIDEIEEAMVRYIGAAKEIPVEWLEERNSLIGNKKKSENDFRQALERGIR